MRLFEEACAFAAECHRGQIRKKDHIPYILHPMEVAAIAATMTEDENVLSAAMLHDVVEDTAHTIEEIYARFGETVGDLVRAETEKSPDELTREESWYLRKKESIEELKNTKDINVKILWLSDKLSNMRSFHRMYLKSGSALWANFHQTDPKMQKWYYESILENVYELKDTAAYMEYQFHFSVIFEETKEA